MESKNVIIIGSGIGGIAVAGYLSGMGHRVTIFEKNEFPGGRCGRYIREGHRFDIGATFMMMPGVYREAFSRLGREMTDELTLHRMDPVYKVKYKGEREIRFTTDMARMQDQLEAIEPGSYGRFLKLMGKGFEIYEKIDAINRSKLFQGSGSFITEVPDVAGQIQSLQQSLPLYT